MREIHKRAEDREEVEAVWEPIIGKRIFQDAQRILQANRDRYHRRSNLPRNPITQGPWPFPLLRGFRQLAVPGIHGCKFMLYQLRKKG